MARCNAHPPADKKPSLGDPTGWRGNTGTGRFLTGYNGGNREFLRHSVTSVCSCSNKSVRVCFCLGPARGGVLKILPSIRSGLRAGRRRLFWYDLSPIVERQAGSENLVKECPCFVRVALKIPNEKDIITED